MKLPKEMGPHWPGEPLRFTYAMAWAVAAAALVRQALLLSLREASWQTAARDHIDLLFNSAVGAGVLTAALLLSLVRVSPVIVAGLGLLGAGVCAAVLDPVDTTVALAGGALVGSVIGAAFVYVARAPSLRSFVLLFAAPVAASMAFAIGADIALPADEFGRRAPSDGLRIPAFAFALIGFVSAVLWGRRSVDAVSAPRGNASVIGNACLLLAVALVAAAEIGADTAFARVTEQMMRAGAFGSEIGTALVHAFQNGLSIAVIVGVFAATLVGNTWAHEPVARRRAFLAILAFAGAAALWLLAGSSNLTVMVACGLAAQLLVSIWYAPIFAAIGLRGRARDIVIGVMAAAINVTPALAWWLARDRVGELGMLDAFPDWATPTALLAAAIFAAPALLARRDSAVESARRLVVSVARSVRSKRAVEVAQSVLIMGVLGLVAVNWRWLLGNEIAVVIAGAGGWLLFRALVRSAAPLGAFVAALMGGAFIIVIVMTQRAFSEIHVWSSDMLAAAPALTGITILQLAPVGVALAFFNYARHITLAAREREVVLSNLDRGSEAVAALFEPFMLWRGYRAPRGTALGASLAMALASFIAAIASMLVLATFAVTTIVAGWAVLRFVSGLLNEGLVGAIAGFVGTFLILAMMLALVPLGLVVGQVATWIKGFARLLTRQTYESLAARDTRPPILFLRSFSNDQFEIPNKGALDRAMRGVPRKSKLDHVLVENFSRYGPVVAIGRPGDKDLPFGAARLYVTEENWKNEVLRMANEARAIVIVLENAHGGLGWEIETVTKSFGEKTLFLTHHGAGAPDMFADWMEQQAGARPGTDGIAHFTLPSGAWLSLEAQAPSADAYELALRAFFRRERLQLSAV